MASEYDPGAGALDDPLPAEPFTLLAAWLAEAFAKRVQPNPHAVALATADTEGRPSVRLVLCKALEPERGAFVFFTNRDSRKGRELAARPWAAAVFHWDALDRQARLEGPVTPVSDADADAYFATRPAEAQLGAWASAQSAPIASRRALEEALAATARRFGVSPDPVAPAAIPRPPHWGGYRLSADCVELWVGRRGRLHDRARWGRDLGPRPGAAGPGPWRCDRLQP
jgi:pyridoxamine 5'-phosphate oxidase